MDENTVQYGTGGSESWWRKLTRRSVLIPAFAVLFIGIGIWVVMAMRSTTDDKETTVESIIKASDQAYETGDYKKSLEQLQAATDKAQSKEEKIVLYSNLAAAAASTGDMTKAIEYLEEKHKIAPETEGQDAYLLGTYYERTENNAKAIDQYKKAIKYYEDSGDKEYSSQKIESLKVRIESLGG